MQKMIRSPATPGLIGPLWCLHLVAAIYARPRNKGTNAGAAARAGIKMSKKFNIKFTKNESRKKTKSTKVQTHKREGDRANTSVYKLSSSREQEGSPQAKGSSFRRPESASSGTWDPEYKRTSWSRAQATRIKVFFLCLM